MDPRSQLCERARSWASLRVDDELSELESALLEAHLGRCSSCRGFARGAEKVAAALRATRLERCATRLERPAPPVSVPRRAGRRSGLRALQGMAAAALVVSAGVVAALSGPSGTPAAARTVVMVAGADSPDGLRELRRPALVERGRAIPRNLQLPGEPV
jgi:predicted anti-sigma-YlaC factor YlaD